MTQTNEIVRGKRAPSREFQVDAIAIKERRARIRLSQPKFAALLNVDVGTLRNWEQGRCTRSSAEVASSHDSAGAALCTLVRESLKHNVVVRMRWHDPSTTKRPIPRSGCKAHRGRLVYRAMMPPLRKPEESSQCRYRAGSSINEVRRHFSAHCCSKQRLQVR
jgi:DNA-binding XRE family transcriptional regulator